MKKIAVLATAAMLLVMSAPTAEAYDGHWHGDIHHFHDYDMGRWHSGSWVNSFHGGRSGWWWVVGPEWYYYPAPVYPYPDPFVPSTIAVQQPQEPGQYWYCGNPSGYYPYIPACYVPWRAVSIQAQPVVVQVPPPAQPVYIQPQPRPQPQPQQPSGTRDADDRKLNALAVEFYNINPEKDGAGARLDKLGRRVEAFRQSLFERDYNAMDILKDTEKLEGRIAAKKKQADKEDDDR